MINKITVAIAATLISGSALASKCAVDFDFIAPQGHDGRANSMASLQQIFKAGAQKNEAAFTAAAADPYIQHSPDLADGIKPVYDLLTNRPEGFSSKSIKWLGDGGFIDNGNYLVMMREVDRGDGTSLSKIFDLMYFDDDGKYAEHWDIRQPLVDKTASGRSEVSTASEFTDAPVSYNMATEESNRRLVAAYLNQAFNGQQLKAALELYASPTFVQHNPVISGDGIQPVLDAADAGKITASSCYDIQFILAQNDFVWVYSKVTSSTGVSGVVDMMRVRDSKIVEHWNVDQAVPAKMPHSNGMF